MKGGKLSVSSLSERTLIGLSMTLGYRKSRVCRDSKASFAPNTNRATANFMAMMNVTELRQFTPIGLTPSVMSSKSGTRSSLISETRQVAVNHAEETTLRRGGHAEFRSGEQVRQQFFQMQRPLDLNRRVLMSPLPGRTWGQCIQARIAENGDR